MNLDFNAIPEQVIPLFKGGAKEIAEGHEHQLVNDGAGPLVFLAVVPGPKA